jgi:Haspin like kinase domain
MLSLCESILSETKKKNEPLNNYFVKTLDKEAIQTWVRVRLADKNGCQTIQSTDGRQFQGFVEVINDERGTNKKLCTWIEAAWVTDEQAKEMKSNEFFHEYVMNMLVKKYLSDIPSFSRASLMDAVYSDKDKSYLHFRNVDDCAEMENVVNDMTGEELRSVLLQVFASICVAQERIQLKHHDLHLGNIMISPTKETSWTVDLPFGKVIIPIVNLHATIIDYGLSSATDPETGHRFVRLDEELLVKTDPEEDEEWGVWGPELKGDEGYDVAMLVESIVEQLFKDRPLDITKLQIIATLQQFVNVDFTERGRPMQHCTIEWKDIFAALQCEPLKIS